MKRSFSIVLVFMFTVAMLLQPVAAIGFDENAVTTSITTDELICIASKAFPEYASKIRGDQHKATDGIVLSTKDVPRLVKSETRLLDGGGMVTYQEYSNGVTLSSIALHGGQNVTNEGEYDGTTFVTLNMYLVCSAAVDSFLVENVGLNYSGSSAVFASKGTPYGDGTPTPIITAYKAYTNSASSPAYLEYGTYVTMKDYLGTTFDLYPYLCLTLTPTGYTVSASWTSILS